MVYPYITISTLTKKVELALNDGKINLALELIYEFVERIITEPVCTAKVFASLELDRLCTRIGQYSLANLAKPQKDCLLNGDNSPTIVYVVSRLQRSGGHSRLVQDFTRAQPEKNHLIVSTEIGGPSDIIFFSKLFSTEDSVRFIRSPGGNFESRLRWLQSTLLSSRPEHVYLLNHHQDSVAVSAFVPELDVAGSFCHHGDHHLCLGVNLTHLTHIDFHPMGYHYCRDELGINNQYLPLTFEDKNCEAVETNLTQGGDLITATAAHFNKVEIPYYISYAEMIPRVLLVTGGRHVHIGKLTLWMRFRIYREMHKQGVPHDRFIYIDWVPSIWRVLREYGVGLYIASFPYGAGLTLVEVMGAGVPVIMHEHMYSRVLSGLELAYPEAYRWSDLESLYLHLSSLEPGMLIHEGYLSRQQYEKFHRPEILHNYFANPNSFRLSVPILDKEFKSRDDEWAAWAESQMNFSRIIYRYIYRLWRKFRLSITSIGW